MTDAETWVGPYRLVRELGRDHAVLLSTHVVPEAESVCTRALLLEKGRLAHQGSASEIAARLGWQPARSGTPA